MRFRNLEKYKTGGSGNNMTLGIPLPKTPDGRVYRYSPNENAHPRLFLLGERVPEFVVPETTAPARTGMSRPPHRLVSPVATLERALGWRRDRRTQVLKPDSI